MPIYEFSDRKLSELPVTPFSEAGIHERSDLQFAIRDQINVISPDTIVIAEEFGDWDESKRRIDLLGVDKHANLVVIELKRSADGGHMDLQAIRYAAMVASLTFEKATEVFAAYLADRGRVDDAQQTLLSFLGWTEPNEELFAKDVRLVLAAADFSKELTTSVLWLTDRDIDIRCVRIRPHSDGARLLLDIQQVIPLPEAREYLIGVRAKATEVREARRKQANWDGDWYINVGMDDPTRPATDSNDRNYERHWDLCREHGYLSAGGALKYWKPLVDKLRINDRVWAYQSKAGYVGTGIVKSLAVPIHDFKLKDGSRLLGKLDRLDLNSGVEPDKYAYAVGVDWGTTFPLAEARHFPGIFANPNIVCKLTDEKTLAYLRAQFTLT